MDNNYLQHYGIPGMKWGIRRAKVQSSGKSKKRDSDDYTQVKEIRKKKISQMSNKELETANKRLNLERNYKDLTKRKSRGKQAIDTFISTAGTIAAVTAAYGTYKKFGTKILEKIGSSAI